MAPDKIPLPRQPVPGPSSSGSRLIPCLRMLVLYGLTLNFIKEYEARQAKLPFKINVLSIWKVSLVSHFDTARASSNRVMKLIDTIGHERILFGSDIP